MRGQKLEVLTTGDIQDGGMNIPEQNNGYPDILDEADGKLSSLRKCR